MFTKSHRRTASGVKRIDITLNVEELTAEERLSRSLHSHSRRLSNATERPRIFEWFLVIGVDESTLPNNNTNTATTPIPITSTSPTQPSLLLSVSNNNNNSGSPTPPPVSSPRSASPSFFSSFVKPSIPHSPKPTPHVVPEVRAAPKILYQYPPDKPMGSINVETFPFPAVDGIPVTQQSQTASHTNLFQLLYTQHHLKDYEDSFVFMLTDERKEVLYGVSTMKVSPISKKSDRVDVNEEPEEGEAAVETGDVVKTAPKCYVILSKYPFFPLHFNILNGVLAIMHMQQISRFQNLISAKRFSKATPKTTNGGGVVSDSKPPLPLNQSTAAGTTVTVNGNNNNSGNTSRTNSPITITTTNVVSSAEDTTTTTTSTIPSISTTPSQQLLSVPKIEITSISNDLDQNLQIKDDQQQQQQPSFQSRLQIKEPIKDLVDYYYNQAVPMPGQTISFTVPNLDTTISFRRSSQRPRNGVVPELNADFNELCQEYGLFLTIQLLSHKTLLVILSAILLEKRVVFYSKSLRSLTSVIFAVTSLLKPFTYQSVLLPIIPDSLKDVLSAPVPFICGINSMPHASEIDYNDVMLVDIENNKIQTTMPQIILFPGWKPLSNQLIDIQRQIKNTLEAKKQLNYVANELQEALLDVFAHAITNHLNSLFEHFKRHCIKDVSNPKKIVSVFIPETFLVSEYDDIPEEKDWITQFMRTQIFKVFEDKTLRLIDGDIPEVDENNTQQNNINIVVTKPTN